MSANPKAPDRVFSFLLVSFLVFVVWASCVEAAGPKNNVPAQDKITYRIIPLPDHSFGYDIFVNGKHFIHQPHIPALPGKTGFSTKEKAGKVAAFVARKIRRHEIPPTVTVDDLKKMKVLDSDNR
jgi:hypothetical protein